MAMKTFRKTRFGCSPGCLVVVVLALVAGGIGFHFVMEPIREGKKVEQQLIDTYAAVDAYVPAAKGAIAPQRMEIFLKVRTRLIGTIEEVQDTIERIDNFEDIEDRENPSASENLAFLKDVSGFLPQMVAFLNVRNTALLDEKMGLGEYFYIFTAAYGNQMCPATEDGISPAECEYVTKRTTRELAHVLQNQLEVLEAQKSPADSNLVKALGNEILGLKQGNQFLPWQNGLPAALEASLNPYRQRLDRVFSNTTRRMELMQKNKHPLGIME